MPLSKYRKKRDDLGKEVDYLQRAVYEKNRAYLAADAKYEAEKSRGVKNYAVDEEFLAKVFNTPDHPTNQRLRETFGVYDVNVGYYHYNPTKSEMKDHMREIGVGRKKKPKMPRSRHFR